MQILMVLTSHGELGDTGEQTGFWLEEFAAPYYTFTDSGADVTLASPLGGQPPLDPKSDAPAYQTEDTKRFQLDSNAQAELANTARLDEVSAEEFDAVFYPGGHGPMWDLPDNPMSISLIESFVREGKPIAAVCHAPVALTNVRDTNENFFIAGKEVTGFTNSEEEAVGLAGTVPFLLENRLAERGARVSKAEDFSAHVRTDGTLVTGQNPNSSRPAAEELLTELGYDRREGSQAGS